MPLPERWNGIFYSRETGGDLLFDLTPEEFGVVAMQSGDVPAFLFAGAHFDHRLHGQDERAALFLDSAKKVWPDAPWSAYEMLAATALPTALKDRSEDHDSAVSNAISYLFTGVMIIPL